VAFFEFFKFKYSQRQSAAYQYKHHVYYHAIPMCTPNLTANMTNDWHRAAEARMDYWNHLRRKEDDEQRLELHYGRLESDVMDRSEVVSGALTKKSQHMGTHSPARKAGIESKGSQSSNQEEEDHPSLQPVFDAKDLALAGAPTPASSSSDFAAIRPVGSDDEDEGTSSASAIQELNHLILCETPPYRPLGQSDTESPELAINSKPRKRRFVQNDDLQPRKNVFASAEIFALLRQKTKWKTTLDIGRYFSRVKGNVKSSFDISKDNIMDLTSASPFVMSLNDDAYAEAMDDMPTLDFRHSEIEELTTIMSPECSFEELRDRIREMSLNTPVRRYVYGVVES
ncbi:hypothetical protein BGX27_003359, partial [Mortierella sp. AM989]